MPLRTPKKLIPSTFQRVSPRERPIPADKTYSVAQTLPHEVILLILRECLETDSNCERLHAIEPPLEVQLSSFLEDQRAEALWNQETLFPLLLVCKNWYGPAISLLYTTPVLKTLEDVDMLASTLTKDPELSRVVQSLYLVEDVHHGRLSLLTIVDRARHERHLRALLEACPCTSLTILLPLFKPEIRLYTLGIASCLQNLTLNGRQQCLTFPGPNLRLPPLHAEFFSAVLELPCLRELCLVYLEVPPLKWPSLPALRTLRFVLCQFTRDAFVLGQTPVLRTLELTCVSIYGSFYHLVEALQSKSVATLESIKFGGGRLWFMKFLSKLDFAALPALRSLTLTFDMTSGVQAERPPHGLERASQIQELTIVCAPRSLDINELHRVREKEQKFAFFITNFISDPEVLPSLKRLKVVGDSGVWEMSEETERSLSRIDVLAIRCERRNVKLDKQLTPRGGSNIHPLKQALPRRLSAIM